MTPDPPTLRQRPRSPLRSATTVLVATLLCIAPILYAHRESPRTLVSAHGLLHTAIAQRFASTSFLDAPPENPFFAGAPVPYYWFFHYCGERLAQLLDIHPLHAFECMILAAVLVVWLTALSLGHHLYGGIPSGLALGVLILGGTNPFGVLILLGKILLRGSGPLHDDPNHLWGIAHPVMSAARLNDPYDLYGPPINFFFNITARPIGLALVGVVALCLLTWSQRPSLATWLALTLMTALCTAFSVVMGAPAALALSGALVAAAALPPTFDRIDVSAIRVWRRRALGAVAALLLGVALAAPTYTHFLFGEAERQMELDFSLSAVVRLAASGGVILLLATLGTLRRRAHSGRFLFTLLIAGLALVGAGVFLRLPVENQCNLFQAGAVLLAVPALGAFVPSVDWSLKRIRLMWATLAILFLPTMLLVGAAYLNRPAIALTFSADSLRRIPADAPLARLYSWVREQTPPDAVFVLDPGPPFTTAVGNVPEFPALTSRVMFTSYPQSYMVSPHRDAARRVEIARRLVAGDPLDSAQTEYVTGFGRPLYLVVESAAGAAAPLSPCQRFGGAAFVDGNVAVCRISPSRASSMP